MDKIPDYLNDLNAMHEAETLLTERQLHEYSQRLEMLWKHGNCTCLADLCRYHVPASMRAEAIVLTMTKE
jgi:hypothetical protein